MARSHEHTQVTPLVILALVGIFVLIAMMGSVITNQQSRTVDRSFAQIAGAHPTRTPTSRPDCNMTLNECNVAVSSGRCPVETHRCSSAGCYNGKVRCALRGSTGGGGIPSPTPPCPGNPNCPNPTITPRVGSCGALQANQCAVFSDYYGCSCTQCNKCVWVGGVRWEWRLYPPTCSKGPQGSCEYPVR